MTKIIIVFICMLVFSCHEKEKAVHFDYEIKGLQLYNGHIVIVHYPPPVKTSNRRMYVYHEFYTLPGDISIIDNGFHEFDIELHNSKYSNYPNVRYRPIEFANGRAITFDTALNKH